MIGILEPSAFHLSHPAEGGSQCLTLKALPCKSAWLDPKLDRKTELHQKLKVTRKSRNFRAWLLTASLASHDLDNEAWKRSTFGARRLSELEALIVWKRERKAP